MNGPDQFLRSNSFKGLVEVFANHMSALDGYDLIAPRLETLAGGDVREMFAKPSIIRGNGETESKVTWFSALQGPVHLWRELGQDEKLRLSLVISSRLQRFQAAAKDSAIGTQLAGWLNVPSLDTDLVSIGGEPCFLNWGLLPENVANNPAMRTAHHQATFGVFLHIAGSQQSGSETSKPASGLGARAMGASDESGARFPSASNLLGLYVGHRFRPWIAVTIANIVAAALLAYMLMPQVLLYAPASLPQIADVDPEVHRQGSEALQRRIEALRKALAQNACPAPSRPRVFELPQRRSDWVTPPPGSAIPGSRLAPDREAGRSPPQTSRDAPVEPRHAPIVPAPAPQSLPAPSQPPGSAPPSAGNLVNYLDKSTVLVVATGESGSGMGTGFFVSPTEIVTNYHVIQKASSNGLVVMSEALGRPIRAQVVARTSSSRIGGADFAVLKIAAPVAGTGVLKLSEKIERLVYVIATGYPAAILNSDDRFKRLRQGDPAGIAPSDLPKPIVTRGEVIALQDQAGTPVAIHTALVSPGNSGGPLVDACGNVLGVNTFISAPSINANMRIHLNHALRTQLLVQFLRSNNIAFEMNDQICSVSRDGQSPPAAIPELGGSSKAAKPTVLPPTARPAHP